MAMINELARLTYFWKYPNEYDLQEDLEKVRNQKRKIRELKNDFNEGKRELHPAMWKGTREFRLSDIKNARKELKKKEEKLRRDEARFREYQKRLKKVI